MEDLVKIDELEAVEVFTGSTLDALVEQIREQALSAEQDLSTAKGRKAVASSAYTVSKMKTKLDGLGKALVDDKKSEVKKVDAARKKMRDSLDSLRDEIREPLNKWELEEQAEKEAVVFREKILRDEVNAWEHNAIFDERREIENARKKLEQEAKEQADRDRAELLQKEAIEKAKREADERIIAEKIENERLLRVERERVAAAESATARQAERAKIEKAFAVEEERKKAEREAERIVIEREAREKDTLAKETARKADFEHRRAINADALAGLVGLGLSEANGKTIIRAILADKIKNVTINY